MVDLTALRAANANRFARAKLTRAPEFAPVAHRLAGALAKSRYQAVSARTGVPCRCIAVVHERECSQSWYRPLAQRDRWDRKSVSVPAGRGPFKSWEDCAVDALVSCAPFAARNKDWSIGGMAYRGRLRSMISAAPLSSRSSPTLRPSSRGRLAGPVRAASMMVLPERSSTDAASNI
ncbi:lysozyme family protein [Bradyrhizobium sp. AZCC 2230]